MPYCSKHGICKIEEVEEQGTLVSIQFISEKSGLRNHFLLSREEGQKLILELYKLELDKLPLPIGKGRDQQLLLQLRALNNWKKDPRAEKEGCRSFFEYCQKVVGMSRKETSDWVEQNPWKED